MIIEVSRNMFSVYAVALMYCLSLDEPMGSTGSGTMNRQAFRISPIGVVLPDFKDTVNVQTKESRPRLRFSSGMPKLQKVSDYSHLLIFCWLHLAVLSVDDLGAVDGTPAIDKAILACHRLHTQRQVPTPISTEA